MTNVYKSPGGLKHDTGSLESLWTQVVVYVDGTRVGEALASEETPHHIIHRLCELDLAVSDLQQPPQQKGVGFRLKLPNLMQGKHEVRRIPPHTHPRTRAASPSPPVPAHTPRLPPWQLLIADLAQRGRDRAQLYVSLLLPCRSGLL